MSAMSEPLTTYRHRRGLLATLLQGVHCEDGSAAVELGLASAVLFSMIFGMMQMSRALYIYNWVSEASHEGARYAMV